MIRGLRIAAAAMAAEQVRLDAIAHNLANSDTAGFRRLLVTLHDAPPLPLYRRDAPGLALGSVGAGPEVPRLTLDLRAGDLVTTGDDRDIAIDGMGFLVVEGGRLVRGGRLAVDSQGYLTISGARVEGRGPLQAGRGRIEVQPDGTVRVDEREIGRLRIVSPDAGQVAQAGIGFYRPTTPGALREGGGAVRQGAQERAAVNPIEEIVQMIAGMRTYEAAQRAIQVSDETMARAAEQVARVG